MKFQVLYHYFKHFKVTTSNGSFFRDARSTRGRALREGDQKSDAQ